MFFLLLYLSGNETTNNKTMVVACYAKGAVMS